MENTNRNTASNSKKAEAYKKAREQYASATATAEVIKLSAGKLPNEYCVYSEENQEIVSSILSDTLTKKCIALLTQLYAMDVSPETYNTLRITLNNEDYYFDICAAEYTALVDFVKYIASEQ